MSQAAKIIDKEKDMELTGTAVQATVLEQRGTGGATANLPTKEQIGALVKAQQLRFIKNFTYDTSIIEQTDEGAVAHLADGEEIPLLDMSFELKIVQPGHITNNDKLSDCSGKILVILDKNNPTEDVATTMNLMPITIVSYGFRYFAEYDSKDKNSTASLLCYSNDGILPSTKTVTQYNDVCARVVLRNGEYQREIVCPNAMWIDNAKPKCREQVTLGFFDLERKIPVYLQLHGSALGAWNELQRSYRQMRNVARLKRKSINDYIIQLSVQNKGTYVIPQFKIVEPAPELGKPSDYLPVCKYYFEKVFNRRTEEEPASGSGVNAAAIAEVSNAKGTEEDKAAVAEGQSFSM